MSEQAPQKRLPQWVEPRKLVTANAHFTRFVGAEDMPRIVEAALEIKRSDVDVTFDRDEQGRPEITGALDFELLLECQRCLEPMTLNISKQFKLAIVWDEAQAKALPKNIDPWIVGEGEADLAAIIEEEILLALPVVAKHSEDCLSSDLLSSGDDEEVELEEKQNPFGVLASLKDKQ